MPSDTLTLVSEAPPARAEEIARWIESLDLPEGRLSEADLERVALTIAARPELFVDLIVDDEQSRWWLLLYRAPNFEVKLLTWERNQPSDWHDHAGSSGVFAVTSGALTERRRGDDYVSVETRTFAAGERGSFGPSHIHDVVHASGKPAVSIHAYSPPLTSLTFYDQTEFGFVAREIVPEEDRSVQRTTPPSGR